MYIIHITKYALRTASSSPSSTHAYLLASGSPSFLTRHELDRAATITFLQHNERHCPPCFDAHVAAMQREAERRGLPLEHMRGTLLRWKKKYDRAAEASKREVYWDSLRRVWCSAEAG